MIKAVLWDNDGLLLDSEAVFFELTRSAFAAAGYVLTPEYWGREYLGRARRTREVALEFGMSQQSAAELIAERDRRFLEKLQSPLPLRPAVRRTLDQLRGRLLHGVVTGSPREKVELMHRHSGLDGYFDIVITFDDVKRTKPHPEPYRTAMERLGLQPRECLAVEDSERGLASAHAAGLKCIVVPNALTACQRFEHAHAVEQDVSAVEKYCCPESL
ncbi:HAD family phosphatase [Prosthecochloris sp. N3]|uniref:HAD family phosphatase n=2 Tax=Chlorobiaceae TaxID=191412 RepID=A0ABR9XQF0_9CHLB|nr:MULTISPECIES: HAD family phosphatase [Prosthecochloris]MBF0586536.1 HAD family phosphatase [Prosthecochloris ethylica]MBF0636149.1 HAD family phosphatase [Prosthecochloris ethylica]NUK47714.1 HAD family phosphatase [Prosthecochloris ethylica]RNA65788.1 HAD family phosphatase [Prosthecochloris sp. ZM_2]